MVALIAVSTLAGCGGSGGETTATNASTSSRPAPPTGASQQQKSNVASGRKAGPSGSRVRLPKEGAGPAGPSPRECVAAWNRAGPAPSLKNVLVPAVRASGPFRALVWVAAGRCDLVVHAAGVEGTEAITYEVVQRPDGAFVQGQVPKPPGSAPHATLERNGSMKLSP